MTAVKLEDVSILMVVPSRVLGAVLSRELGGMGVMQMACCKNIREALECMRDSKPDLVVSSMYFEDGDGIDLITAMRNEAELENTLFMLISGEERFEMLDPIRQAGVVAMLPRPFTREALDRAVSNSLGMIAGDRLQMSQQDIARLRVLLVDDSRLARKHMMHVLQKMGIEETLVFQAENGAEAIDKLERGKFDLVLTDYNMPDVDGEALLRFIRQHETLHNMPVIMVTSEQNESKLGLIKSHGVTAMLDKPFDAPHLKTVLEQHL
ncbi:MAG TPA: response regulator [Pseudomonadales bacterium]